MTKEEKPEVKGFDDFDLRLGDVMRGERATMGKSLLDVQRDLKIKATYISAIENADPSAFETKGFIAGYVRSYARYLGLDPEWAYARFCEEGNFATSHGMSPEARVRRPDAAAERAAPEVRDPFAKPAPYIPPGESILSRIDPGAVGSILVLVLLIGVIGYGGWSVFREIQKVQFAPVDQAPGVTSDIDVLEQTDEVRVAESGLSGFEAPAPDALDRLYRPEALDVPVMVARDGPIVAIRPGDVGTLAPAQLPPRLALADAAPTPETAPTAEAEPEVQVVAADVAEVRLFAVRPSWVRVQAADGSVIFEKILDAGESFVLPKTEEPPVLRAGNAGSLYFAVNGEHYGPAGVGPSVVKNIVLDADALTGNYQVADVTKDTDLARFIAVAEASQ